ncbi:hypothetical protein NDU88_006153 [Pleurodeles waltl]|uniref:Uncharacterized protein n=1 Tax=Pleurodeles waltl TaxID=8319 RepID=A0AAV7SNQ9_PLEWA|nr:hypothetical protein NDU88_006153 [Pleurodeles waltl]
MQDAIIEQKITGCMRMGNDLPKDSKTKCGSPGHLANSSKCFARNVNRRNCGKKGHLVKVCKSYKINAVDETSMNQQMILHVNCPGNQHVAGEDGTKLVMPKYDIEVDGKVAPILAESGSPFTLIGDNNWEMIFGCDKTELSPPDIDPIGYGGQKINLFGYSLMTIKCKGQEAVQKVYVAKHDDNVLGWKHQRDLVIILNPNTPDQVLSISHVSDDTDIVN